MLDGVRGFLFDFDDTLVSSSVADAAALRGTLASFASAFGAADVEDLVRAHDEVLLDVKRVFHATGVWAYPEERFARLLAACGRDAALAAAMGAAYYAERLRRLQPFPGAREMVARLRTAGYRVGIVTNGPARQREWMRSLGFLDLAHGVAIAGEEGVRKPDPRLFVAAMSRIGSLAPREIAVVGDSFEMDVAPARRLGMRSVYVAGEPEDVRSRLFDNLPPDASQEADADLVVRRVRDLAAHVPW